MARQELPRALGIGPAASLVVGIVIGSSIFVSSGKVAAGVDNVTMLFGVWLLTGLLTLLGALTYAEFGAMFPQSGGDYVYAGEGLGRFWGFFNGWLAFSINYPASLAALALLWAQTLDGLKPGPHEVFFFGGFSLKFTAIALLAIFTIVNYLGVRQGGATQFGITATKVALILGLVAAGLLHPTSDYSNVTDTRPATALLSVAIVQALFAYDGWTGVTRVAGEIRDPQRNLPRALGLGMLGVVGIYLLVTAAYLAVLGLDGMGTTNTIGATAAQAMFGTPGKVFVSLLVLVSIAGPINGLTLAGPRVYYAMARDGLFPHVIARLHPRRLVPHVSIIFQSVISGLLIVFFTADQLFGYVILASWTAYMLTGLALLRLRMTQPDRPRPYRVPGYPAVPILFVVVSAAFLIYLFVDAFTNPPAHWYLIGNLAVMALGIPVYAFFVRSPRPNPD